MTVKMDREGPSREDPVPPPPSPSPVPVTHVVVATSSPPRHHLDPEEGQMQETGLEGQDKVLQAPDVTSSSSSQPSSSSADTIIIPSSTATLDLLQETSRTLSIECKKGRLLSTSPASPSSVTPDVCCTPRSPRQLIHPGLNRMEDEDRFPISSFQSSSSGRQTDNVDASSVPDIQMQEPLADVQPQLQDKPDEGMIEEDKPGQYRLKWIKFKGNKIPIITQNENGPCPLIAIMNVLLLKGQLRLPSTIDVVTSDHLMEYLGHCILSSLPSNLNEGAQLNFEQNMMDAIAILPKLQTGLDVNVKFTSISDFEFTPELIVFDLLHIPLHHGWIIDPINFRDMAAAIGSCSYNQLVDKIITNKSSVRPELVTEALIAEEFLESTASQLTYYGLEELVEYVKDDDPCVLFRNNHFITLYRLNKELYQLVTDQGFLNEPNVIWETLNNIEGDGKFVDEDFKVVPPKLQSPVMTAEDLRIQEDQDYLIALSLQEEYKKEVEQMKEWEQSKVDSGLEGLSDEELARKLQAEEEARLAKEQQQLQLQQQGKQVWVKDVLDRKTSPTPRASSSSSGSLHRVHGTQTAYPRNQTTVSNRQIPQTYAKEGCPVVSGTQEESFQSRYSSSQHNYPIHQEHLQERPSSASSRDRHHRHVPPRKSASMQESDSDTGRVTSSESRVRAGSERQRSDHHSRAGGKSKSSCSVM